VEKKRSGGEAVADTLAELNVRHVFGIPGVHNLGLYDALLERAETGRPPAHRLVRHEQSAVFAADGYARATGRPGVAIATTGPGALNAIAALNEAACSDVPVLLLASQIHSKLLGAGRHALHEMKDQIGAFRAVVEHGERVEAPGEIPARIHTAFARMARGPGRAVYLEIPHDCLTADAEWERVSRPPAAALPPSTETMEAALAAIRGARHPALLAGGGVVQAAAEAALLRLAERLEAPVLTTSAAKGALPAKHSLHAGVLMAGASADALLARTDLLIALGTRLGHRDVRRVEASPPSALIHVDSDPAVFGRNWRPSAAVKADVGVFLDTLLDRLGKGAPSRDPDPRDLVRGLNRDQGARNRALEPLAVAFLEALAEGLGEEGILAADQAVMGYWCELYLPFQRSRAFLYPGGSGVLGYALPAALGAKTALPDRPVAVVIGDGGFHFTGPEFGTMVQHRQGVPVLVFNDNQYGVIRYLQARGFRRSGEVDLINPDFVALARATGGIGVRLSEPSSLPAAMREAFGRDVPTLIEIPVSLRPPW
jgi:acetolactate synthase-1/2/3 large subunit